MKAKDINKACVVCGLKKPEMTKDHFYPRSSGGSNCFFNYVPMCFDCNNKKGAKSLFEWLKSLENPPASFFERALAAINFYHDFSNISYKQQRMLSTHARCSHCNPYKLSQETQERFFIGKWASFCYKCGPAKNWKETVSVDFPKAA